MWMLGLKGLNKDDDDDDDDDDAKAQPHFQGPLFPLLTLGMKLAKIMHALTVAG